MDVENKPGTYGPGDYTHPKLTAIGWQFTDEKTTHGVVLDRTNEAEMVVIACGLDAAWEKADAIVGHNFRRHDMKLITAFFVALGLRPPRKKRIIDTYLDQPRMQGYSRSLENLADRWGCPIKKLHLSEYDWERAYDGIPDAQEKMLKRVKTDVQINIWLYHVLVEKGLL